MKKNLFKLICLSMIILFTFVACNATEKKEEQKTDTKTEQKEEDKKEEEKEDADKKQDSSNMQDGPSIKAIKEKGKLVVGTSADYPPYEFKALIDGKQEIVGFDIEIAKKIAEKLGVELEVKDMDFKVLIPTVKSGQIDIVIAGLSPNPEREKQIGLSQIYYDAVQTVLVRKADLDSYKSLDDLKGKKIGAQMGSIQEELAKNIENSEVKALPLITALIVDLKTEKVDAIVMEKPVAEQYASNNEEFAVPQFEFEDEEKGASIGVKKENTDLLEFVNSTLDELKADGSIDKFVVNAMTLSSEQAQN